MISNILSRKLGAQRGKAVAQLAVDRVRHPVRSNSIGIRTRGIARRGRAGFRRVGPALAVCVWIALAASPASAVDLAAQLSDLADPTPGRDLWRLRISVSGDPQTAVGDGASLALPQAGGFEELRLVDPEIAGGWHVVALPDAPAVPLEGAFEAFALGPAPAPREVDVEFVWTGAGAPSIGKAANAPLPAPGAPICVPEPGPQLLGLGALAVVGLLRRRRARRLSLASGRRAVFGRRTSFGVGGIAGVGPTAVLAAALLLATSVDAGIVEPVGRSANVARVGEHDILFTATHVDRVEPGTVDISFHLQVAKTHIQVTNAGAGESTLGVTAVSSAPSVRVLTPVVNVNAFGAIAGGDRVLVVRVDRRTVFEPGVLSFSIGAPGPAPPGPIFPSMLDDYPVALRFDGCALAPEGGFEYRFAVAVTNSEPVPRSFVLETATTRPVDEITTPYLSFEDVPAASVAAPAEGQLTARAPGILFDVSTFELRLHADLPTFSYVTNAAEIVDGTCALCHVEGGLAQFTPLVYEPGDATGNLAVLSDYADANPAAATTLLRKPQGLDSHGGGGVLDPRSDAFLAWQAFVGDLTGGTSTEAFLLGVDLLGAPETLRKAAVVLAGRTPTPAELAVLDAAPAESSDAALRSLLRAMLHGASFEDFLREGANDRLLVEKLRRESLGELIRGDFHYPAAYLRAGSDRDPVPGAYRATRIGLIREPLALIVHVVTNELPYTEILTADYVMMNPYSNVVYLGGLDFSDPDDPEEWRPGQVNGLVHLHHPLFNPTCVDRDPNYDNLCRVPADFFPAGLLTSTAFLNRYPSTATNRNRARARWAYDFFLGIDIENTASRLQPDDLTDTNNPTLNNRACAVCHERLDPVAGAFQDHDDDGIYRGAVGGYDALHLEHKLCFLDRSDMSPLCVALREECADDPYELGDTWYCDMREPGFVRAGDAEATPYDPESGLASLQWLAREMTADPRFATGAVRFWFRALYGRDPIAEPEEPSDVDYAARLAAWQWESEEIARLAGLFASDLSGNGTYNAKDLFVEMVMSPLFRANRLRNPDPTREVELAAIGMGRLLTPEQLERKLSALAGTDWREFPAAQSGQLTARFPLLYGGIDSDGVTTRTYEMTALMQTVADTMANEAACPATLADFGRPAGSRLLFPHVEPETTPNAVARTQRELSAFWLGELPAPEPESLALQVDLRPGTYRALVVAPNSVCDFDDEPDCPDLRSVIVDRITVTGPSGGVVVALEAEDATTAPGLVSPSFEFETTFPFGGQGRVLATGGYVGVDFTVRQTGAHEITARVWGDPGRGALPRAVLVVEERDNDVTTWGARAIRENLAHLHWQLLGERVDAASAEVADTYQLFLDILQARVAQTRSPFFWVEDEPCAVFGPALLETNSADPLHGIRSWQAVLTALLGDYRFLHE